MDEENHERLAKAIFEKKIIVTTNNILIPAQHTYEGAGFKLNKKRNNHDKLAFSGEYIDYVYEVR